MYIEMGTLGTRMLKHVQEILRSLTTFHTSVLNQQPSVQLQISYEVLSTFLPQSFSVAKPTVAITLHSRGKHQTHPRKGGSCTVHVYSTSTV